GVIVTLFPNFELPGLVRISLGIENTKVDVDELIRVLGKIAEKSGKQSMRHVKKQLNDFVKTRTGMVFNSSWK
ncbi:MAG: hypothetical protein HQ542_10970, partial [Bacteroidia bacterium]|nr:hypothetical protein [Bacteroidia bacterium]